MFLTRKKIYDAMEKILPKLNFVQVSPPPSPQGIIGTTKNVSVFTME